ncbi:Spy/CpxP family protein refolding chaperone [Microcoleus sp. FACHB-SPT15]|uniref:Spy/CpxP family protein refolding chaperone n=1 Tax=Microcoleus sp. FACHB-SPT15 TaxID=2692830 RepID=UPI00177CD24E|nr:Spy/CpxP family protein refolding chaperone [Microcoleus sp. FACHB-SPT15]MBD1805996.1 Spy/CpxP family protein refolding chaperone [Microcoleus sp. FACHB-SPT15]
MLLRRVSIWSVLLLAIGGVVALVNPKPLTSQIEQNVMGQARPNQEGQSLVEELNLTPQQDQQLKAIQQEYKDQMAQQRQELQQAQQELSGLMAGTASQGQIRDKYREVNVLRQQKGELHLESMLAIREILTPQQRRQFARLMQQQKGNFRTDARN